MPCHDHTMILAKHGHDQAMMTAWHVSWHRRHDSWHDHAIFYESHVMIMLYFMMTLT